jgi:hypothetical protein
MQYIIAEYIIPIVGLASVMTGYIIYKSKKGRPHNQKAPHQDRTTFLVFWNFFD